MKTTSINKIVGITSIAASALGIYYLVKKNKQQLQQANPSGIVNMPNNPTTTGPAQDPLLDLIGRTVVAKANHTNVFEAINRGEYWEKSDNIRLVSEKNSTIGTVVEIIHDGFSSDSYAIIDIPFYVGPLFNTGHGFINVKHIKAI